MTHEEKWERVDKFAKKHYRGIYQTNSTSIALMSFIYGDCDHYIVRGKCELCDTEDTIRDKNGNPICYQCDNVALFGYQLGEEIVCDVHRHSMGNDSVLINQSLWFINRYDFIEFNGFSFRATVNGEVSPGWSPLAFPVENEARDEAVKWAKEHGATEIIFLNERGEIIR